MLFRQLFGKESSTYTYLLADEETLRALLIDHGTRTGRPRAGRPGAPCAERLSWTPESSSPWAAFGSVS